MAVGGFFCKCFPAFVSYCSSSEVFVHKWGLIGMTDLCEGMPQSGTVACLAGCY